VTTTLRGDLEKSTTETGPIDVAERAVLRTWLRMLACTNMIEGRVRGELREIFETTLPRFDLLAQLDAARIDTPNGLTMSELSRRLMVTNGNLTGLVDSLVREGLVGRVVSPQDRRAQLISLTPAGKRGLDSMTPAHAEWIREMFDGLTEPELRQFYRLLGKLKRSAQKTTERTA
jgi:DNA-binding MarR family transcriptional regulator